MSTRLEPSPTTEDLTAEELWLLVDDPRTVRHGMYDEVGGPLYAAFCASDRQELAEYTAAVRRTTGDVLELAAGAGRLTLPLLATGRNVLATELSPTMLRLLEERLLTAPRTLRERCEVAVADMRSFAFGRRFGAVVLGTTSISLLNREGRAAMLACVREHLAPGGVLLVSTLDLAEEAQGEDQAEHVMTDDGGREYLLAERVAADGSSREVALAPRRRSGEATADPVCVSTVAVLRPSELIADAERAGLVAVSAVECAGFESRYRSHLLGFAADAAR